MFIWRAYLGYYSDYYLIFTSSVRVFIQFSFLNSSCLLNLFVQDRDQWSSICCALGSKCYLIAEDAATQISKLTTDQNINIAMCSGVVLKYTNQTKVSDLIELTGVLDGESRGKGWNQTLQATPVNITYFHLIILIK